MTARCMTCGRKVASGGRVGNRGLIPVEVFQQAFEESDISLTLLAHRLGWFRSHDGRPDTTRVRRQLGLIPNDRGQIVERVRYETAVRLTAALGLDPVEVGL